MDPEVVMGAFSELGGRSGKLPIAIPSAAKVSAPLSGMHFSVLSRMHI
jgi:hypothetical protein